MKHNILLVSVNFCLTLYYIMLCVKATLPVPGPCPTNLTAVSNFDMSKFAGRWYLHSRYPHLAETMPKCISIDIKKDGETYNVVRSELVANIKTKRKVKSMITGVSNIGKFNMNASNSAFPDGIDTWVLATDYDKYAVRFMCIDIVGVVSFQWAAIYTREHQPTKEIITEAEDVIKKSGLDMSKMKKVEQHTCPPA